MKKSILMSIIVAIAMVFAFVSCGEKQAPKDTEEAIAGTPYVVVTTPNGAVGVKEGGLFVVEPRADYKAVSAEGGMFVVTKTDNSYTLVSPETGYETISGDTLLWKDFYFEGKFRDTYLIYIPAYGCQFAAQSYVVKGDYAVSFFNGRITAYKAGEQMFEPTDEYSKVAVLPEGKLLVLNDKTWGTATVKEKSVQPGRFVTPRDLKKFKSMKGWDETSPVMILE